MRGGDVVMELASRCGYTVAVEVAPNKIAQNIRVHQRSAEKRD